MPRPSGNIMPPPVHQTLAPAEARALPLHPFAEWLPPMSDAEYAMLRDDIRANGQRQSIVLHDGALLDGRHRVRACIELDIPVRVAVLPANLQPDEYVMSANLRRRNVSGSQLAMIACRMVNSTVGNQGLAARSTGVITQDEAGARVGVSGRYVRDAAWLTENHPDLAERVWRGDMALSAAVRNARRIGSPDRPRRTIQRTEENPPSIPQFPDNPAIVPAPAVAPTNIMLEALRMIPTLDPAAWLAGLPREVVRDQLPAADDFFRRAFDLADEEGLFD